MSKRPREIAGFVVLPVILRATVVSNDVTHYIYLKPHEPRIPNEDSTRSLFLVNIPVFSTEIYLRHLFAHQLSAGRVERVEWSENGSSKSAGIVAQSKSSKKRKRMTVAELETSLNTAYSLPDLYPSRIHQSGATAVVTFVDRAAMELSLRAARKATKSSSDSIVWGAGIDSSKLPPLGLTRYEARHALQYPDQSALLAAVDDYMTAYSMLETAVNEENAKKRSIVDEDGFTTVTRGSKSTARRDEAEEARQKEKVKREEKARDLEGFYRFQNRQRRKDAQGEMIRKFQEDRRKVEELKKRRKGTVPES